MNLKLTFRLSMIAAVLLLQTPRVLAADPNVRAFDSIRISYEREERIKELEAEVQRLKEAYAGLEKAAQGKISALEDEVKYLNQVLQNVRSQVGGGGYGPNSTEPKAYVE